MPPPERRGFPKSFGSWVRSFDWFSSSDGPCRAVCNGGPSSGSRVCRRKGRIGRTSLYHSGQYDRKRPSLPFLPLRTVVREKPFPPQPRHRTHAGQYESPQGPTGGGAFPLREHPGRIGDSGPGHGQVRTEPKRGPLPLPSGKRAMWTLSRKSSCIFAWSNPEGDQKRHQYVCKETLPSSSSRGDNDPGKSRSRFRHGRYHTG